MGQQLDTNATYRRSVISMRNSK